MDDKGQDGAPACLCLIDGVNNAGYLHGIGECPCNDFSCVQVHDACQIDKAVMSPNISNVCTPDGVGTFWIELFVQNVMKLAAEIRVTGGGSPRLYPLCLNAHFLHVCSDRAFCDTNTGFAEFSGDFGSTIILV